MGRFVYPSSIRALFALAYGALGAPSLGHAQGGQRATAITHVTVVDVEGARLLEDMTVVMRNGRFVLVAPASRATIPAGSHIVSGIGQYMIPGLHDMHIHLAKTGERSLDVLMANGVTSVRDMGGDFAQVSQWRTEIAAGTRIGPRIKTSGPILESASNVARMLAEGTVEPVPRFRASIGEPRDVDRVVDSVTALGVDFLKIRTVASAEVLAQIGAAARRNRLALVGHSLGSVDAMIGAGYASIEHALIAPLLAGSVDDRSRNIRRLVEAGVVFVPTMVVGPHSLAVPDSVAARIVADDGPAFDSRRRYVGGYLLSDWREQAAERRAEKPVDWPAITPRLLAVLQDIKRAGGVFLAGTDAAVVLIYPGFALHEELELMVSALGMTPAEALATATTLPAKFLGTDPLLGSIVEGKLADFVLLSADPLDDIRNSRCIVAVAQGGRVFDRRALDRMLDRAAFSRDPRRSRVLPDAPAAGGVCGVARADLRPGNGTKR